MCDCFIQVFSCCSTQINQFNQDNIDDALADLSAYMSGGDNPLIRMFIDRGGGRGNQAGGVRMLDRLMAPLAQSGLAYAGAGAAVEMVYDDGDDQTVVKLRELLGFDDDQDAGPYPVNGDAADQVALTLIALSQLGAPAQVNLGFSGVSDEGSNMAVTLNCLYYLRFQPFLYDKPTELQQVDGSSTNLSTVPQLGGASYTQRGYAIDVADVDWGDYTGDGTPLPLRTYAQSLQYIIENITDGDGLQQYDVLFTYSIHSTYNGAGEPTISAINSEPDQQVTELLLGVMAAQYGAGGAVAGALPVVIVNLDGFYTAPPGGGDPFAGVQALLAGGPTRMEQGSLGYNPLDPPIEQREQDAQQRSTLQIYNNRSGYLNTIDAANRATFSNLPDLQTTTAAITALLQSESPSRQVLWVQFEPLFPSQLFNYLFSQSTLPTFFEGVNTANLALNLGNLYYHSNRPGQSGILYPTRVLASRPGNGTLQTLQSASDQVGVLLRNWPTSNNSATYPPEVFAGPIKTWRTEGDNGTLHTYFTNLQAFYQDTANDKLSLALTYFNQIANPPDEDALLLKAGADDPLDALYTSLEDNLSDGTLELVPGALTSGTIFKFLNAFVVDNFGAFVLTDATVARAPESGDITTITVTGSTSVFGVATDVELVFTAPDGATQVVMTVSSPDTFSFDNMDWIVFGEPLLELTISDGFQLTHGTVGASVSYGDGDALALSWTFPSPDDEWLVNASFSGDYPSINNLFQLAGGLNLVTTLPAPFNVLSDLGLAEFELTYDQQGGEVENTSFTMATQSNDPILLVNNLYIQDLSIQTTVLSPGSLSERTITTNTTANFDIGTGDDAAVIQIAASTPDFVFSGDLVQGVITFDALTELFLGTSDLTLPPGTPEIDQFSFSYNNSDEAVQVSVNLNLEWTITVGSFSPVTIESLGLQIANQGSATTGKLAGDLILFPDTTSQTAITVAAESLADGGWLFSGEQTAGALMLGDLLAYLGLDTADEYGIDGLKAQVNTSDNSWSFSGGTAEPWVIDFLDLSVAGSLSMGASSTSTSDTATVPAGSPDPGTDDGTSFWASIQADVIWGGIEITAWFNYAATTQSFGFTWGLLQASVEKNSEQEWVGTLAFTDSVSLGSIVETMVSWLTGSSFSLEAPWDALNSVSLSGLALIYNFTKGTVAFEIDIGPIDLIFARIDSIAINYISDAGSEAQSSDTGVMVTLKGSFPWNTGTDAMGDSGSLGPWDAATPGAAPAPSGNGNKYLDLRLLAMGQHVTSEAVTSATTVQEAVQAFYDMPDPTPGEIPPVQFDANSSWLFGTDFGVLKLDDKSGGGDGGSGELALAESSDASEYLLTLQVVFNDPYLYALRIALAGDAAKIFKGLDFQILYRQISDTVGVYQSQITLPDAMRRLSIGAYTIVLPVFAIDVYTNGDFQVDIGFPWNNDFSRSLTIEAIIPPGIPVTGSAGFYFGKLSSATTDKVPAATNGTFNPVLVFGFGMQVGFGKSVEYGVLSAGFSLTVVGILEGVIAKWNPYAPETDDDSTQIQNTYYFWIQGTVGIVGKLYGSVDFGIVKADVNVELQLLVQITYESYVSISISVIASVDVSASIKINMGLFKITISFSFSMKIKETFTIENSGTPPWITEDAPSAEEELRARAGVLGSPARCRQRVHQRRSRGRPPRRSLRRRYGRWQDYELPRPEAAQAASGSLSSPNWSNLEAAGSKAALSGYVATALTAAYDEWASGTAAPSDQQACYVGLMLIESVDPATSEADLAALADSEDTSFEVLAKMVLRWTIAAIQSSAMSADQIDAMVIEKADLEDLLDEVLVSTDDAPSPFGLSDIDGFMSDQFAFTATLPTDADTANATYFPMAPALSLSLPAYGDYSGYGYSFSDYNALSQQTLSDLRSYFDQLAIQVESEGDDTPKALAVAGDTTSMATWVQSDYFLLIARQMVQGALDALRDFKYPLQEGQSPDDILDWVSENGASFTLQDLFQSNESAALTEGVDLWIAAASYLTLANQTFDDIAQDVYGGLFEASALATQADNTTNRSLLTAGGSFTYGDNKTYAVQALDSLDIIATALGYSDVAALVADSDITSAAGLLATSVPLLVPPFQRAVASGETLKSIAALYALSAGDLAADSSGEGGGDNGATADLFDLDGANIDIPHLDAFTVKELIDEAQRTLAIQHLSAMASRYYFHGMRLPTDGITPLAEGMWVQDDGGQLSLPPAAGLFALTGQQFPLPDISGEDSWTLSFSNAGGPSWLDFADGDGGTDTLSFAIAPDSDDNARIQAVLSYATSQPLDTGLTQLGADSVYRSDMASYPFNNSLLWQYAAPPSLPYGQAPAGVPSVTLWLLPDSLTNLPDPTSRAINPRFSPSLAQYNESTGATDQSPVSCYGWGTTLSFTVKKVPASSDSPASQSTYEVVGASSQDATLMERMLAQEGSDDDFYLSLTLGYAPDQSGDATQGIQTDSQSSVTMGIAQVNLSTVTTPDTGALFAAALTDVDADDTQTLLNTPSEYIRLLWEAAITRSGGFYLYYYCEDTGEGLPDRVFNDKDEATLTLVVLFARPDSADLRDNITDFTTVLAVGESIGQNAMLYAVAEPPDDLSTTSSSSDSLSGLGYAYYTDVGDIAAQNAALELSANVALTVGQGVYQVGPSDVDPGGDLSAIAAWFQTTGDAIKAANPSIADWPDPLPQYTAIHLPTVSVPPGGAWGSTLADISAYFGVNLTSLAAQNQSTEGLFTTGQTLDLPGGPTTRTATVAPGVAAVGAARPVPPEPPDDPSDEGYAQDFLLNDYTMLNYQVVENADFSASNLGLPAGPTPPPDDAAANTDKIRLARTLSAEAGDEWSYKQSIPFPQFFTGDLSEAQDLPAQSDSPYLGVGAILQVSFLWQDLYGNTLVTSITEPQTGGRSNQPPVLLGYTDALIGVGQWPAVASSWAVSGESGSPELEVTLLFDPTRYQPADSDKWQENAQKDLGILTQLYYQLTDPNGVTFQLTTSILADGQESVSLGDGQVTELLSWLFYGDDTASSIYAFVQDRANGNQDVPTPPATLNTITDLSDAPLNEAAIYELTLSMDIVRTSGLVQGDFQTTNGIASTSTSIAPLTSDASDSGTLDLTAFASDFETAMSVDGLYQLKIAVGSSRAQVSDGSQVWATRLGLSLDQPVAFEIQNVGAPGIYAPQPISNTLQSRPDVPIYDYTTGKGLSSTSRSESFTDIDMDQWGQLFFAAIDDLLTPEFTASIQILSQETDYLQLLLDQKQALADIVKAWMIPVFTDESGADTSAVRESFYQSLLTRLSNAYTVQAALRYDAAVNADITDPLATEPPRLYGNINVSDASISKSLVSLTSPKLTLSGDGTAGTEEPLPILISAPTLLRDSSGAVVSSFSMDLSFDGSYIEHQISSVPGIQDYLTSSWLSLVLPEDKGPLYADLGTAQVPVLLRSFPTSPTMAQQSGSATATDATDLSELILWDYSFTYSLPFHYPQDEVNCEIEFNINSAVNALASVADAFNQLAQFVTVYPSVSTDLTGILATVDATTTDPETLTDATVALESLLSMVDDVTKAASASGMVVSRQQPRYASAEELNYSFSIREQEATINGTDSAQVVVIVGDSPIDMDAPQVLIAPDDYDIQSYDGDYEGLCAYWYKSRSDGTPLLAAAAQSITARQVVLGSLNVLQRQDAWSTIAIQRNQNLLPDRTTASAFCYTTPDVQFANPLFPTLDSGTESIDISTIGMEGGEHRTTSLADQLAVLMAALLAKNVQEELTFQVSVMFSYNQTAGLIDVTLPCLMQAPLSVSLTDSGGEGVKIPEQMISDWSDAITLWFDTVKPVPLNAASPGELTLDMTIMSDLTTQPMPLLRLRKLTLPLEYIDPTLLSD